MTKRIPLYCLLVLYPLLGSSLLYAQTCSCAGAPLLSSQSIATTLKGDLLVGLSYEYNDISNLYNGQTVVTNESSRRNTQSTLLEVHYGLTHRLTLSGTFTYVQKQETTGLHTDNSQTITTRGIGDGLFLLKYTLFQKLSPPSITVRVGGGGKIPFGNFHARNNGFPLNADMQPGSGAWDGIVWSNLSGSLGQSVPIQLNWTNTYRHPGEAERFNPDDHWRFGNEFVSTLGATGPLWKNLSYTGGVRYRSASSDQRNDVKQPNTGGYWLSLLPGLGYSITNKVSARVQGRIPLVQELNGIQPTTQYALQLSLFVSFSKSPKTFF